jgi:two-component sensor histidine kinase
LRRAGAASPSVVPNLSARQVHLVLAAPPLVLQSAECWLLGLIVYELITNAIRHAFHGRNGEIRVELLRAGAFVHCKVMTAALCLRPSGADRSPRTPSIA